MSKCKQVMLKHSEIRFLIQVVNASGWHGDIQAKVIRKLTVASNTKLQNKEDGNED